MKKKVRKKPGYTIGKNIIPVLLFVAIIIALLGFTYSVLHKSSVSRIASDSGYSLQLGTFHPIPSPTPTPTPVPENNNACNHDNGIPAELNSGKPVSDPTCSCPEWLITCKDKKCVSHSQRGGNVMSKDCSDQPKILGAWGIFDQWCSSSGLAPTDGTFCLGKPVIYLYPVKPEYISVRIETPGDIFISNPLYPTGEPASPGKPASLGGWENVYAQPDGTLSYKGKNYNELFYESKVKKLEEPKTGITLYASTIKKQLDEAITKLGLVGSEKTEFLDWWVPRLQALHSPFIQFSVIDPKEKERVDKVMYSPKPDTRIEFIAYFKPLLKPYEGKKLLLPKFPPQRIGFTAVEWGGTISKN